MPPRAAFSRPLQDPKPQRVRPGMHPDGRADLIERQILRRQPALHLLHYGSPVAFRFLSVEAEAGDSLTWCTSGPCKMDIYAGTGERLVRIDSPAMPVEHKMKAGAGGLVTALVYAAGADTLAVCCGRTAASGITSLTEAGMALTAAEGLITLTGAEGGSCTVYGVDGCAVARRGGLGRTETFAVAKGVYVVAVTDRRGKAYRQTVAVD